MRSGKGIGLSCALPAAVLAGMMASWTPAEALGVPQNPPTTGEERLASFEKRQQMERESLFQNMHFRNIGPTEMNGRIVDVEFPDPDEPFTFLIAYASGGLFKTTNNGTTFEPLFDDQAAIIMGDVAVGPDDPDLIWVGTGERNASRSTYSGAGVYKSTDGGKTWKHMGLADAHRIAKIVISPRDPNTVWVAAQGPLFTDSEYRGIYKTTNGGRSWRKVLYVDERTGASDLVMHPTDPNVLYAAMWTKDRKAWDFVEGGEGSGVWRSDDGGERWRRLEGGLPRGKHVGRIGLAVTPAAPDLIYASVDNQAPKPEKEQPEPSTSPLAPQKLKTMTEEEFLALKDSDIQAFLSRFHPDDTVEKVREMVEKGELKVKDMLARLLESNPRLFDKQIIGAQVWRSSNRGRSWKLRNEGFLDGLYSTYGYYFGDIAVSPVDKDEVYLLGVPLIKSTDGGRNWKRGARRGVHSDMQAIWINPKRPQHVVLGNDGGLNITYDGGETWQDITNVPAGQFYAITVDMAKPYNVYGGLQDNGVWMGRSDRKFDENRWTSIGGGDGMRVQVDTRTNQLIYYGTQFGNYNAFDRENNKRWRVRPRSHIYETSNRFNWQSPVVLSPHSQDIVYFGTQRLYRSLDRGRTFTAISDDLTTSREPGDVPFSTIVTLSESPKRFGLIYVGTDDGLVHVTRDGGYEWTDITRGLAEDRYVSRVVASMHEEGRVYVSQTGYRNDDFRTYLFRSDDYGRNWRSIRGDLPDEPVNVIREDPKHEEILYIGTDLGSFITLDGGKQWQAMAGKLPHVPVQDLVVHPRDNDLVLGTHGRSIFIVDIAPIQRLLDEVPVEEETETAGDRGQGREKRAQGSDQDVPKVRVIDKPLHLYKVDGFQQRSNWKRENQRKRAYWREPPELPKINLTYYTQTSGKATLTLKDSEGNVVRRFEDEAERGINLVEWDYTLDPDLAKKAEEARLAKMSEEERKKATEGKKEWKEWMTWFITPGTWTLEIKKGRNTEKITFKVTERRQGAGGRPFGF